LRGLHCFTTLRAFATLAAFSDDSLTFLLNPPSLTPTRLPRFSANGQNFKTFSKRERNGKDHSRASTKEMTVKLEKVWLFDWYGNTFLNFQK
jgi:hypothetical protein